MMKSIEKTISTIVNISLNLQVQDRSLMNGIIGNCLFYYQYTLIKNTFGNTLDSLIREIIPLLPNGNAYTFCNGKAGINWYFTLLHKKNIIGGKDLENICYDDFKLQELSLVDIERGNFDFLYGGLGIAYYHLYSYSNIKQNYFNDIFIRLKNLLKNPFGIFQVYDFEAGKIKMGAVDFGLAHGIVSVLKFCTQCYKQDICKTDAENISRTIISYLIEHKNIQNSYSFFPNGLNMNVNKANSRLAWCYGDLGMGFMIYQAGFILEDITIRNFAMDILVNTTSRRSFDRTKVNDAFVCHGSAGVAHIYNKIWKYTKCDVFRKACDFWIEQTIDRLYRNDILAGMNYNTMAHNIKENPGLLDGVIGAGLVLSSYLTDDFSWDYCLMLN